MHVDVKHIYTVAINTCFTYALHIFNIGFYTCVCFVCCCKLNFCLINFVLGNYAANATTLFPNLKHEMPA